MQQFLLIYLPIMDTFKDSQRFRGFTVFICCWEPTYASQRRVRTTFCASLFWKIILLLYIWAFQQVNLKAIPNGIIQLWKWWRKYFLFANTNPKGHLVKHWPAVLEQRSNGSQTEQPIALAATWIIPEHHEKYESLLSTTKHLFI